MSIIIALIIGGIIGWIATAVMGEDSGVIVNIVVGIVGALIGGYLSMLFTGGSQSYLSFTWSGFFWSLVGALVLAFLIGALRRRPSHTL